MSDDLAPVEQESTADPSALTAEIEALRRKNSELLTEKKRLAKADRILAELPEGTDVRELLSFKQATEQQKLESAGADKVRWGRLPSLRLLLPRVVCADACSCPRFSRTCLLSVME